MQVAIALRRCVHRELPHRRAFLAVPLGLGTAFLVCLGCSSSNSDSGSGCTYQGSSYPVGVISSDPCGMCTCDKGGHVSCTEFSCQPPPGAGGGPPILGTGGSESVIEIGALDASRDTGGTTALDATADANSTDAAQFEGGSCGTDTCSVGQVCVSLTTVSGQYNPNGGSAGQPTSQSTKSCRSVPAACPRAGSCDSSCCSALCGGGGDALCSCSLGTKSAGCTLGLP
jgi:hypothetical protein